MSDEANIKLPTFRSKYLNDYMAMVEDTESPRLFHVWGALFTLASAMGRRCYLPTGVGEIYPNPYILFVGKPSTKKSTAIRVPKRLLKDSTNIRIAPNDTAGHRQGLVRAMSDDDDVAEESIGGELNNALNERNGLAGLSLEEIGQSEVVKLVSDADRHNMTVLASEFTGFIGQNNKEMLDFLTQMWDGDSYSYKTKNGETTMDSPLISVLSGTTPTSIASAMPATSAGQGFLSRIILVYGSQKYKEVPWPELPPAELVTKVESVVSYVHNKFSGAFTQTPDAKEYATTLYSYKPDMDDPRFTHYIDRRFIHLIKTAMAVAASQRRMELRKDDYMDAHVILCATEKGMPDALGQFGLSPDAQVKQGIVEFLKHHRVAVDISVLHTVFHRDVKRLTDLNDIINDLIASGQIVAQGKKGTAAMKVMAVQNRKNAVDDEMINALAEA